MLHCLDHDRRVESDFLRMFISAPGYPLHILTRVDAGGLGQKAEQEEQEEIPPAGEEDAA